LAPAQTLMLTPAPAQART